MGKERILGYFGKTLPERCGYRGYRQEAISVVVGMIYEKELADPEFLSGEKMSIEDRAMFALPYPPIEGYEKEYQRGRVVAEAVIMKHRMESHGDVSEDDLNVAIEGLDSEELEIVVAASAWDH